MESNFIQSSKQYKNKFVLINTLLYLHCIAYVFYDAPASFYSLIIILAMNFDVLYCQVINQNLMIFNGL